MVTGGSGAFQNVVQFVNKAIVSVRTVDQSILLVVCDGRRVLGQASLGCHAFVGKCRKLPHGTRYHVCIALFVCWVPAQPKSER